MINTQVICRFTLGQVESLSLLAGRTVVQSCFRHVLAFSKDFIASRVSRTIMSPGTSIMSPYLVYIKVPNYARVLLSLIYKRTRLLANLKTSPK